MITVRIHGGMGNQMFMYACAYALAKRLDVPFALCPLGGGYRTYSLCLWPGVTQPIVSSMLSPRIKETGMAYNPNLFPVTKENFSIDGYFQSEKYFEHAADDIRRIFVPSLPYTRRNPEAYEIYSGGDRSTFLTVRRTDYLTSANYHRNLPQEYYDVALDIIYRKVGKPLKVFIFSDDIEWCKKNFTVSAPHEKFVVSSPEMSVSGKLGREDEDIWLMSQCRNGVMANSSFAWWGAWLGVEKNVVAPAVWFGPDASDLDTTDLIPKRWIKI